MAPPPRIGLSARGHVEIPLSEATPQQTNPMAIASLVCGVLSMFTVCFCYGLPFNAIGLLLGVIALVQSSSDPRMGGKGFAYGGIAASMLSFLIIFGLVFMGVGLGVLGAFLDAANH